MYLIYGVPGEEGGGYPPDRAVRAGVPSCEPVRGPSLQVPPARPWRQTWRRSAGSASPGMTSMCASTPPALRHGERLRSPRGIAARARVLYRDGTGGRGEATARAPRVPRPWPSSTSARDGWTPAEARWRELLQEWPRLTCGARWAWASCFSSGARASEGRAPTCAARATRPPRWPHAVDRLGWCLVAQGRSGEGAGPHPRKPWPWIPARLPPAPPQRR